MQLMIADRQNAHDAIGGDLVAPQLQQRRHRAGMGLPKCTYDPIHRILAAAAIFGNLLLYGCAALPPDSKRPESAYQALHAVDFAQTIQVARSPNCYRETDEITKRVIGEHPTEGQVRAAWALTSAVHLAVTDWLDREVDATDATGWKWARATWHVLTIADAGRSVIRNRSMGFTPFGGNRCTALPPPKIVDPPRVPGIGPP